MEANFQHTNHPSIRMEKEWIPLKTMLTWAQMTIEYGRLVASSKAFGKTLVLSSYLKICRQGPQVSLLWLGILEKPSLSGGSNLQNGFWQSVFQYFLVLLIIQGSTNLGSSISRDVIRQCRESHCNQAPLKGKEQTNPLPGWVGIFLGQFGSSKITLCQLIYISL